MACAWVAIPRKVLGKIRLAYMKPIRAITGRPTGKHGVVASDIRVLIGAGMPSFSEAASLARLAYFGRVAKSALGFLRCALDVQPDWANEVRRDCAWAKGFGTLV